MNQAMGISSGTRPEEFWSELIGVVIPAVDFAGGHAEAFEGQADGADGDEHEQNPLPAKALQAVQHGENEEDHGVDWG